MPTPELLRPGGVSEPFSGRHCPPASVAAECRARATALARRGLRRGDAVLIHHGNSIEFFTDLLAIWQLDACAVPVDPRLTPFEIENIARTVGPKFSLWHASFDSDTIARLQELGVDVMESPTVGRHHVEGTGIAISGPDLANLDDPALVLFTSGTTSDPKGVVHTHRSLRARWNSLADTLGSARFERTLCLLPTHFGHGLICNALFPWLTGHELLIAPSFRPDVILQLGTLLDDHRVSFLSSVPALWRLALRTSRPPRLGTVRTVICGSAPLSTRLWCDIQEWSGAADVINAYGITETASWVAGTTMPVVVPADGLVGVPWGASIKVVQRTTTDDVPGQELVCSPGEQGRVWLKTPALMRGYLGRDDLTHAVVRDGWFCTGDIGTIDDRGWLYLRGREREEINKGGMKVYPGDIDSVIDQSGGALDVCTFAYGDPLEGENIGIALVLPSADEDQLRLLHRRCAQQLASFQIPQRWYLLSEIPRTARGKVNRSRVAELCATLEPIDLRRIVRAEPVPSA